MEMGSAGWILALTASAVAMAAVLWLWWRAHRRATGIPLAVAPARFVEIDGFRVHYVQEGHGPDLVLVHGIGASIYCWRKVFPDLSRHFRVTALDLPGFGQSTKHVDRSYGLDAQTRRLGKFLDAVGIASCDLMGCSMGGTLALWLARLEPGRVRRIAALAPAADPRIVPLDFGRLSTFGPVLHWGLNEVVMRWILNRVLGRRELVDPEVLMHYLAPYRGQPEAVSTFMKSLETLRDPRLPAALSDVKAPVLLLWGRNDKMVLRPRVANLTNVLSRSEYHETDGGHHLMEDRPEWVLELALRFFGVSRDSSL